MSVTLEEWVIFLKNENLSFRFILDVNGYYVEIFKIINDVVNSVHITSSEYPLETLIRNMYGVFKSLFLREETNDKK